MPSVLNASLTSQSSGQPMFVAAYDPARKMLLITSLMTPGADPAHVHQLWVIPADGKPHSLGMIAPGASKAMPMPGPMAPMLEPGAVLAVSVEPPGGSPLKTTPSGPIAATGKLARI
jgi:anti-sigma-K factor RskA